MGIIVQAIYIGLKMGAAGAQSARVQDALGRPVGATVDSKNRISFEGVAGQTYRLTGFLEEIRLSAGEGLTGQVEKEGGPFAGKASRGFAIGLNGRMKTKRGIPFWQR